MPMSADDLNYRLFMIRNAFEYADQHKSLDRMTLARNVYLQGSGQAASQAMDESIAKRFVADMMRPRTATNLDLITEWQVAFSHENPQVDRSIILSAPDDVSFSDKILPFLEALRGQIAMFLRKECPLPLWDPPAAWNQATSPSGTGLSLRDHLLQLGLPVNPLHTGKSSRPDFLLYRLGSYRAVDEGRLMRRTTHLLSGQSHRVVMNTSGSGKTRLLFESLCRVWGLYLTFAFDSVTNPYGSEDLTKCRDRNFLQSVSIGDGVFVENAWALQGVSKAKFEAQLDLNHRIVVHVMQAAILARLLILRIFLVVAASAGAAEEQQRRGWLLLQLFPRLTDAGELTGIDDLFLELTMICVKLSTTELHSELRAAAKALPTDKYPRTVVLDEVQTISSAWRNSFSDDKHKQHRSLLRPVVIGLQKGIRLGRFMIAGTRLYYNDVLNALSSNVFKEHSFTEFTDLGSFVNWEPEMRCFLDHVLTPAVVHSWPSDIANNIRFWFAGRHRFLIFLLQQILMQGPDVTSVRNVIDNIVFSATGEHLPEYAAYYTPIDGVQIKGLIPSAFLEGSQRASVRRARQSVLQFLTQLTVPDYDLRDTELVDLGVGRFVIDDAEKKLRIQINERLVLTALRRFFDSPENPMGIPAAINDVLRNVTGSNSVSGLGFEDAMVYLLWLRFSGDGAVLSDVFEFEPDVRPVWADKRARLIAAFHPGSRTAKEFVLRGLTSVIARNCGTIEDSLDWFVNQRGIPFLKPDNLFGPDIIFALQLYDPESGDGHELQTIYVCVQCKNWSKERGGKSVRKAIFSASPEGFYHSHLEYNDIILKHLEPFTPLAGTLLDRQEVRDRAKRSRPADAGSVDDSNVGSVALTSPPARKTGRNAGKGAEKLVFPYGDKVDFALLRCLAVFPNTATIDRPVSKDDGIYPLATINHNVLKQGCRVGFDLFKRALERAAILYPTVTLEEQHEMQDDAVDDEEIPHDDKDAAVHENFNRDWAQAQAPDSELPAQVADSEDELSEQEGPGSALSSPARGRSLRGKQRSGGKAGAAEEAEDDDADEWMDTEVVKPPSPPPLKRASRSKGKAKATVPPPVQDGADEWIDARVGKAPLPSSTKQKRPAKRPRTTSEVSLNPRPKRRR